mgnify:CR=1 FL=1
MKILKSNQILMLEDPKEYIIDLFVRLCQLNYFTKTRNLTEEEQIEVMLILEAITNTIGRQDSLVDECIDIFRISFNMYKDFYKSWDLVKDYLNSRISLD